MKEIYKQLMTHDVTVIKTKIDGTGSEADIQTEEEKGFVQYDRHRVTNEQGEEITAVGIVFLRSDSSFDPSYDRWDFIDQKHSRRMRMQEFRVIDDPRTGKTHHFEVSVL